MSCSKISLLQGEETGQYVTIVPIASKIMLRLSFEDMKFGSYLQTITREFASVDNLTLCENGEICKNGISRGNMCLGEDSHLKEIPH